MSSSLIRGKYVVRKVVHGDPEIINNGAVFQQRGRIVEVGPYDDLARKYQPDEIIGSEHDVVMPGLVNSHHHVGLTPFQLGSPDYPLELWLASRLAARDVDPYLDTLYSAFEMVQSGVTTVQHIHVRFSGPATRWGEAIDRVLKAYEDIGMRASYTMFVRDQNRLAYEADEQFVRRLPPEISGGIAAMLRAQTIPLEEQLEGLFTPLWERWGRNQRERIRIQLGPANLHWCSDAALVAAKEYAERFGVGMHMHLLETPYQKEYARRRTGVTAVRHLHDLGLLGPQMTLGHGVWLTEEDVDLVAETGTMICHNASSNLRLRSGIAALNYWVSRGVRVAIGIDEAGINDDRDMLQEMRLVVHLHRVPGMDTQVPTAAHVFQMATEYGAYTTGFGDAMGTLDPGKAADVVVMDWNQIAYPYLDEDVPVLDALVYRARTAGVKAVLVGGDVVLRDGHFTRVDRQAVLEELAAALRAPLGPDELWRRELARAVFPHVRAFYASWLRNQRYAPFYVTSSRR
ncbi:MAG: amidohydrolase family protein [Armatimonadetes bacterium]|nr:amidohydrolase family protein [Armatimonadota bacterium]